MPTKASNDLKFSSSFVRYMKLDISWQKQLLFKDADFIGLLLLNGMVKTKLTIFPFLYCGEIVKNYCQKSMMEMNM